MQRKDIIRGIEAVAKRMTDEISESETIAVETLQEFDRLLVECHQTGLVDDDVFRLAMEDKRQWDEVFNFPGFPSITMLIDDLLEKNWDRLILRCNIRELADPANTVKFNDKDRFDSEVRATFALKLVKMISDAEVHYIATELEGRGGAIFRFLLKKPRGVSFIEFQDAEDPDTGQRLTKSEDRDSIKAMLYRLSGKLAGHGFQIKVSQSKDLIKLERYA